MNLSMFYGAEDKMVDLISHDYRQLQVLSRFGISLGFGEKTIKEVCEDNGVDCTTFLAIVNFIINDSSIQETEVNLSIDSLLHYLKQSHLYFLQFCLPAIRRKLIEGITFKDGDVSFLILKLFDEYFEVISSHMKDEEENLFRIAETMIANNSDNDESLPTTNEHHSKVGNTLKELKSIILKYCPGEANANLLNAALFDINLCEEELTSHCLIEDRLLLPAVKKHIEFKKQIKKNGY